jgi:hypothetical protein
MSHNDEPFWSDSVRCGGVACLLLVVMDVVALMKGGREEVPAGMLWLPVAGLLLPVLNVYFVAKDLFGRRLKAAGIGAALSGWALFQAFNPAWVAFLRR